MSINRVPSYATLFSALFVAMFLALFFALFFTLFFVFKNPKFVFFANFVIDFREVCYFSGELCVLVLTYWRLRLFISECSCLT